MPNPVDLFEPVEHVEFAANAQGAEDVTMFFDLTRARPPVQALLELRDAAGLVQRIRELLRKRIDPKFMHPDDPAIAVYLDTLYRMGAKAQVREAWGLCQGHDELYWTNQVAQSINLREQSSAAVAPGTASEATAGDPVFAPPPPSPIRPEDFARTFYALYMETSRARALAARQDPPPRPPWDALPAEHPMRVVLQGACDALLARLQAVPYIPIPPADETQRTAVAAAIRDGTIAARVTLLVEVPG